METCDGEDSLIELELSDILTSNKQEKIIIQINEDK